MFLTRIGLHRKAQLRAPSLTGTPLGAVEHRLQRTCRLRRGAAFLVAAPLYHMNALALIKFAAAVAGAL